MGSQSVAFVREVDQMANHKNRIILDSTSLNRVVLHNTYILSLLNLNGLNM